MWYVWLNLAVALWVFYDAYSRKMHLWFLWGFGTAFLTVIVVPFYLAKRPLKEGERREGGTSWNVIKNFALFWTLSMVAAGLSGIMKVSEHFPNSELVQ